MPALLFLSLFNLLGSPPSPEAENAAIERQGEKVLARLVPLGKTTSIAIAFSCEGGELLAVEKYRGTTEGIDTNPRDLRSGLFAVKIRTNVGSLVRLELTSEFFTSATGILRFNPHLKKSWSEEQEPQPHRATFEKKASLWLMARDGSELDLDGVENGLIELVLGPRDSFWGYALGTLFICFFGIFIVLGILMAGMMLAGKAFSLGERRRAVTKNTAAQTAPSPDGGLKPEQVAALALALYLHDQAVKSSRPAAASTTASNWAQAGRLQLMRGIGYTRSPAGKEK